MRGDGRVESEGRMGRVERVRGDGRVERVRGGMGEKCETQGDR